MTLERSQVPIVAVPILAAGMTQATLAHAILAAGMTKATLAHVILAKRKQFVMIGIAILAVGMKFVVVAWAILAKKSTQTTRAQWILGTRIATVTMPVSISCNRKACNYRNPWHSYSTDSVASGYSLNACETSMSRNHNHCGTLQQSKFESSKCI